MEEARGTIDLLARWAVCERAQRSAALEAASQWVEVRVGVDDLLLVCVLLVCVLGVCFVCCIGGLAPPAMWSTCHRCSLNNDEQQQQPPHQHHHAQGDIDADMTTALQHYADRARTLLTEGSAAKRAAAAAPGNDLTLEGVEVLQELGTTHLPAAALHSSGLVPLMQQLAKHKVCAVVACCVSWCCVLWCCVLRA